MASIRKRGKAWHVQVRRTGFPNLTSSFPTKAAALAWARQLEFTIDNGERQPTSKRLESVRLADLLIRYEATVSVRKRGADREAYKIRVLLRAGMADLPVSKVTGTMIAAYRDHRLTVVKAGTVRRELALLRHCLEVARKEWGISIYKNPFVGIKMPELANARERRLEDRDVRLIRHALEKSKAWYLRPMIELALETGMRRGELLNLKWSDVSLAERLATLPLTKNGKCRRVPLTPRAIELLSVLRQTDERVFPIGISAFRQAWERLMRRSGINDLRFHDLRHEAISRFFEMGLSVPEVALISGHRDYRMLFRYTHIRPSDVAAKLSSHSRPAEKQLL